MRRLKTKKGLLYAGLIVLVVTWWFTFPRTLFRTPLSYVLFDKEENLLGATIAGDGQWRFPESGDVPEKFRQCIVTYEDNRFYYHPGIDPIAIGRSVLNNLKKNTSKQGGSTISMQVMRLSRGNRSRTIWQKFVETIQAVRLECTFSKKRILSLYASHAPFGGNVVGLDAAAWRYFGRKPHDLSWGEMAALAVLPNSPALIHPGRNRDELLRKRNGLLKKLEQKGVLDHESFALATQEPLPGQPVPLPQYAPHLLQRFISDAKGNESNLCVSTIQLDIQKKVNSIVAKHQQELRGNNIRNLCALVVDVETGNVVSYVGNIASGNPDDQSFVDVIKAPRSPGSTLKPILYAAAMSDGQLLPDMLLADVPTQIGGYTPQNFDRDYDGAVPASQALSRSLNIPAVKILQQYKYERFYNLLKQLGITTLTKEPGHYGLSMILGGSETTLWDMVGLYAGLARSLNHSVRNKGNIYLDDFFAPVYHQKAVQKIVNHHLLPALDATSVWYAFQSMQEVMRPGEEGLWQQFTSSEKIAWKTGTSFGFRDAWAIGITSKYVVGVWAGNANGKGRPDLLGVKAAAPVMFDIFKLLPASPPFPRPQSGFKFISVCSKTGFRAGQDCPVTDTLLMPPAADRTPVCPYHQTIHTDPSGSYRVSGDCLPVNQIVRKAWFVLPPTMEWYYRSLHADYKPLPPYMHGCAENNLQKMDLIYPVANAKVYIPVEIDGQRGRMVCFASLRQPEKKIFWHLDGDFIGTTQQFHHLAIDPPPGKHLLTIVDESGESISRAFEIINKR